MAAVHTGVEGRIGPNAILQTYDELVATIGAVRAEALLHAATGRIAATLATTPASSGRWATACCGRRGIARRGTCWPTAFRGRRSW